MESDDDPLESDDYLVLAIAERDEDALRALVDRYGPVIKALVRWKFQHVLQESEIDAVLYEVAYKAWNSIVQYDDRNGSLKTWLLRMAYNTSVDLLRKGQRWRDAEHYGDTDSELLDPIGSEPDDIEDKPLSKPERRVLRDLNEVIEALPFKQREIIKAELACDGVADDERLAGRIGSTVNSIQSLRSQAKKRIREELISRGHFETAKLSEK